MPPDELHVTAHCLLRLTTALTLEAAGICHSQGSATAELNHRTCRQLTSAQWLAILEPHYRKRFRLG
jgi:hypothetical protein